MLLTDRRNTEEIEEVIKMSGRIRVKCQCGYAYEGDDPPRRCPQCRRRLR